jgi:glycosyltransferase involved in cell wall biosynthesis
MGVRFLRSTFLLSTILLAVFVLFPVFVKTISIITWTFVSLLFILFSGKKNTNKPLFLLFTFSILYVFYFISLLYSENKDLGFEYLLRRIPLIVFPVVFYFLPIKITGKSITKILDYYVISVFILLVYIFIRIMADGNSSLLFNINKNTVVIRQIVIDYSGLHTSYLALFIAFALGLLINKLFTKSKALSLWKVVIMVSLILFFFAWLLLISAKMSLIATIILIIVLFYLRLKNKKRFYFLSLVFLLFSVFLISITPNTKKRFAELYDAIVNNDSGNNDDGLRMKIYASSFNAVSDNLMFGVGIGDADEKLFSEYRNNGFKKGVKKRFNTHNQYLEIMLSSGLIAVLLFVFSLVIGFLIAVKNKNYEYFIFLFLTTLALLTENILSRQVGVMFFAFFNAIFAFNIKQPEQIYVNARFLDKRITGVQRFAKEICNELQNSQYKFSFIRLKPGFLQSSGLNFLRPYIGHIWEQIFLPLYLNIKGRPLLLNLENTAPAGYKNQIVTIHDLSIFENQNWFSKKYLLIHKFILKRIVKNSRNILTVSKFSKNEILNHFKINSDKVQIVYNGVSEFEECQKRMNFEEKEYILVVGSLDKRKNISSVIEAFKLLNNKELKLVIVGAQNKDVFNSAINDFESENVLFLTDITDSELCSLYKNAVCYINVSLYEGFGLPVLEAMNLNCPVILSDIQVFRELYDGLAIFVNPNDIVEIKNALEEILDNIDLRNDLVSKAKKSIKRYSFKDSSIKIVDLISTINKRNEGEVLYI